MAEHIVSRSTYYRCFAVLIALTLLTVAVSFLKAGVWHTPIGLVIAAAKAGIVALFFMHLLSSRRLTWLAAAAGLFWLAILIGLTLSDYWNRHWPAY